MQETHIFFALVEKVCLCRAQINDFWTAVSLQQMKPVFGQTHATAEEMQAVQAPERTRKSGLKSVNTEETQTYASWTEGMGTLDTVAPVKSILHPKLRKPLITVTSHPAAKISNHQQCSLCCP